MAVEVSVVVPCHNGAQFVEAAVRSALAQEGVELEVVVVDDGSTDGSADIVRAIAETDLRLRLLEQPNSGVSSARNHGYQQASDGEFVLFLDADDILTSGSLQLLRDRLEADPSLVAAFGTCSKIDEHGATIADAPSHPPVFHADTSGRVRSAPHVDRIGYWHLLPVTPISTPGQCLLRRAALPSKEPFEPGRSSCEDWDLWLRLAAVGDFGIVDREVLRYRDHESGASKHHREMQAERQKIFERQRSAIDPADASRLRAAYRFGVYWFDARLSFQWALERVAERDLSGAVRLSIRSLRYAARGVSATVLGRPAMDAGTS